jgi:hypothetical protein
MPGDGIAPSSLGSQPNILLLYYPSKVDEPRNARSSTGSKPVMLTFTPLVH